MEKHCFFTQIKCFYDIPTTLTAMVSLLLVRFLKHLSWNVLECPLK